MKIGYATGRVKADRWPTDNEAVTAHTNYDDNLFYAIALIRGLQNGLALEIDAEYFRDKTVEDLFFIDRTLDRIYESLRHNAFLVNRREHLRSLMRAKRIFADLLDDLLEARVAFATHLDSNRTRFSDAREKHVKDMSDIQAAIDQETGTAEPESMVSQDEYRFLLRTDDEGEP